MGIWYADIDVDMRNWTFWQKVARNTERLFYQPIRVFCFHQVSDRFDPDTMWDTDWTQTDIFKRSILALKRQYAFISLPEVTEHLRNDRFRIKRYAALTADDGWASLKNILPWLAEQKTPITLFLNPLYLDGSHYQERETEKLLTCDDVKGLVEQYAPFVSIASHGWSHKDCVKMNLEDFADNVESAERTMKGMQGKVSYYAFTYGHCLEKQVNYLNNCLLIPVYMDGGKNYSDSSCIHRELMDGWSFGR